MASELQNYTAKLAQKDAARVLTELAANPRYATFMAGPFGTSLAARFKIDRATFGKVALDTLAANGSDDQRARGQALASIEAARRVIGLARGGRDAALEQIRHTPKPRVYRRAI